MAVLERVMQMKQEGQTDSQIINALQTQGISPKEINEALSQSQIKSAVGTEQNNESFQESQPQNPSQSQNPPYIPDPNQQMQPSIMQPQQTQESIQEPPYQTSTMPLEQAQYPEQYQEYSPEFYGGDIETINEIAQQVVDEKTQNIVKQTKAFSKFKEDTVLNIETINERLEKIENTLDELQISIIKKVGEYGENINNISKEMQANQDSFSKILNPLTDNIRELQKITGKETEKPKPKTQSKKSKKPKAGFEDYLR